MDDPLARFAAWFGEARAREPNDPEAAALATVDLRSGEARADVRMVLVKAWGADGFVFYTRLDSAKGQQLGRCRHASLMFHWKSLRRQVRLRGRVSPVATAEADAYFATRPRESQVSAHVSLQSRPLASRERFEAQLTEADAALPDPAPRPPLWSGFRLAPDEIELWEDRRGRRHHRELYRREPGGWDRTLLYP